VARNTRAINQAANIRLQIPVVLHLADHDPNGIDMSRATPCSLPLYAGRRCAFHALPWCKKLTSGRFDPPLNG
jgi:hypothetical protein